MECVKPKLIFLVTEDWYFCSHRLQLAKSALENGFDVAVITQISTCKKTIEDAGIRIMPVKFNRSGVNLLIEIKTIYEIYKIYKKEKANIFHHVSLKPVIYGSLASYLAFSKPSPLIVNALTGMGYVFTTNRITVKPLRAILTVFLKFLLNRNKSHLIIQNSDDQKMLITRNIVHKDKITVIRGSGVDTDQFRPNQHYDKDIIVMLVARMLVDKGVNEFVSATKKIVKKGIKVRFVLVGGIDLQNPSGISQDILNKWQAEGSIEWWGRQENMPEIYQLASIVVLPSYREGLPKVLLEAAACGLPIIATDVPGCREIVIDGHNGLLVPPKDTNALADAIEQLIIQPELRVSMGSNGRKLVEDKFSSNIITSSILNLYQSLLSTSN